MFRLYIWINILGAVLLQQIVLLSSVSCLNLPVLIGPAINETD